ncbi:Endonuclease/exonuclease/phosphatase [Cyathus striatus]|nr:Endonuclease/exonuclease/phosphatase [Cyathus striatus]
MSPASVGNQMISPHWQQQLLKCEMVRSSRSPHHRARASAMASRTVAKSAIPITNPNAKLASITTTATTTTTDTPSSTTTTTSISTTTTTTAKDSSTDPSSAADNSPSMNHPASTVAPNTWNSLDMGGVNIKNIPPNSGLFTFTFLINLYLNHNALEAVPAEICKLQHLELLDLSGNSLTTLPTELGRLTQLKELYVFDNHLITIPHQFGSLHQLQTLGVEGNPLNTHMKEIIQKDGTPAFICYLRDSAPVPSAPPERIWKSLLSPAEEAALTSDVETFTVLCYNILCERYATERLYGYTPSWALAWEYRRELILAEVAGSQADFLCLQEVSIFQYEEYFAKRLGAQGYEGVHWPKGRYKTLSETDRRTVDGCAVFYKANRYQLVENHLVEYSAIAMQRQDFKKTDDMFNRVLGKDHIAVVCLFEDKHTGTRFIIANTHIHWDPSYSDVKLVQVALLLDEIEKMGNAFAKYPPRLQATTDVLGCYQIPTIIAGDFNSVPDSGLCDFLSSGYLAPNHSDFMQHTYGRYTSEGLKHRLGLKNAYLTPGVGDIPVTNFTPGFKGVLDYVWYSAATLGINGVLGGVDVKYLEKEVGFPNAHFPSDHICLIAEFRVRPPREAPPRPPPPVFHNSHSHS